MEPGVFVASSDSDDELAQLPDVPNDVHRGRGWRRRATVDYIADLAVGRHTRRRLLVATTREARLAADEAVDHLALQSAWDRTRALAGDTTAPGAKQDKHANCWNAPAITRIAFENLGQAQTAAARSDTHNTEVAVEAVSWVAKACSRRYLHELAASPPGPWLYIEKAWDATPVDVEFDEAGLPLLEASRYRWCDEAGNWKLIPYEQARALKLRCRHGVVEMLAQSLKLVWPHEAHLVDARYPAGKLVDRVEEVIVPPVFLERATAANQFAALEDVFPDMNLETLFKMAKSTKFILLALPGDNAASNVRLKAHVVKLVGEFNASSTHGKILTLDIICGTHIIMGFIVRTFRLSSLIPRCYSLNFTMRFPPRYNKLVKLLRTMIEKDLLNGGYIKVTGWTAPQREWSEHVDRVLEMTVMRPCHTKGRSVEHEPGANEDLLRAICVALKGMLTTNIKLPQVGHLCRGCCGGCREAALKLTDGLVSAFVEHFAGKAPSTSKFYTLEEVKSAAAGFSMTHQLGPMVVPLSIGTVDLDEVNASDLQDDDIKEFRARCNRKAKQTQESFRDPGYVADLVISTWGGEAVERLSNQLQHLEAHGNCLMDLTRPNGPADQAEKELFRRCTSSVDSRFGLDWLVSSFDDDIGYDLVAIDRQAFASGMSMAAQLYFRIVKVAHEPPLEILQLLDARNTVEEKQDLRTGLLQRNDCDLDAEIGRIICTEENIDEAVNGVFGAMGKHAPFTNMSRERILALIRGAVPTRQGRKPLASKVLSHGYLALLMRRHLSYGLPDRRGREKRKDLLQQGVRLNAAPRKAVGTPRWHVRYGHAKVSEALETGAKLSRQESATIQKAGMLEYRTLSQFDRQTFKATYGKEREGYDADAEDGGGIVTNEVALEKLSPWEARLGNASWPVNPENLLTELSAKVGDSFSSHGEGVYKRFRSIQPAVRREGLVDERAAIPEGDITSRGCCFQVHPGICAHDDAPIYNLGLQLAACIEKYFTKSAHEGKFHRLVGSADDGQICYDEHMYLSHVRRRGKKVAVTHSFARAVKSGLGLRMAERRPSQFDWWTVWRIARACLLVGCSRLLAVDLALRHMRSSNGEWLLEPEQPAGSVEIWPSPVKKTKTTDPDAREIDKLRARPKKNESGSGWCARGVAWGWPTARGAVDRGGDLVGDERHRRW